MSLSTKGRTVIREHRFSGNRLEIKKQTADAALKLLVDYLEGRLK
jgi:nicotinamide mononucleotide (NMN) deamidase PncC